MDKVYYEEPKTMVRWDDGRILAYLNEEVIENFVPDYKLYDGSDPKPRTVYTYTGQLHDGGTILPCENMADYHDVANAIIRSKYSEADEIAIHRHYCNGDYKEDSTEYEEYNQFCTDAVALAKKWVKQYIGEQTLKNM